MNGPQRMVTTYSRTCLRHAVSCMTSARALDGIHAGNSPWDLLHCFLCISELLHVVVCASALLAVPQCFERCLHVCPVYDIEGVSHYS